MRQHFSGHGAERLIGQRRSRVIPAPAAGAEWSLQLPAGHYYLLLLGFVTFTASAAAANRNPSLQIKDGDGNTMFQSVDSTAVVASTAASISYGIELSTIAGLSGQVATIGVPDVILEAGWTIGSITPGIQAGDQYSAIRVLVEELIDANPLQAPGHQPGGHYDVEVELNRAP